MLESDHQRGRVCRLAPQQGNCRLPETFAVKNTYLHRPASAGFSSISEVQMRTLIAAAMLTAFAFTPASAKMMSCTSDNMMKSTMMMAPGQSAANKEMGMANMDMSNGKMKSACMHYMKAQKMSMSK
jgi:hypothetical protein